jgi:A/G-specific adenine glycosylase
MKKKIEEFVQEELLYWYDNEYILLPWRNDQDPYKIWVSEIMLQQTRVEAVIPYFERFIKRLPTVKDLAEIEEDELMKLWQGLGYYRRVKNMQAAAKQIMQDFHGVMPKTMKDLLTLKGIGEYTAGAIASIAYDEVAPAVDGNVLRIFARLYAVKENLRNTKVRKKVGDLYKPFLPKNRPGDFNQALMDLGRKICIPSKNPRCEECPLASNCLAYRHDLQGEIPFLEKKKARKKENITILVFHKDDKIWIRKRPNEGLLSSLYEYTTLKGHKTLEEVASYGERTVKGIVKMPDSKHIFSHIEWSMIGYFVEVDQDKMDDQGMFVSMDDLKNKYSIPTAFKRYTTWLLKRKDRNE